MPTLTLTTQNRPDLVQRILPPKGPATVITQFHQYDVAAYTSRTYALWTDNELTCVTPYRKGATTVLARLASDDVRAWWLWHDLRAAGQARTATPTGELP